MNELFTYAVSVMLFIFSGFLGKFDSNLGWIMISLICAFIIYNAIVVMRFAFRTIYVVIKTFYVRHVRYHFTKRSKII